jgi:hypothetical protein
MGILSIVTFVRTFKLGEAATSFWISRADKGAVLLSVVALLGYALFLVSLGFLITTSLFFLFVTRFIGKKGWVFTVVYSFVSAAAVYILFAILFKAPLPEGILRGIL